MQSPTAPGSVYLDTSFVVATLFRDTPHHLASVAYTANLVAARSQVVFSTILRLELSQVLARLPTGDQLSVEVRHEYALDRWHRDVGVRARWMGEGVRRFDHFTQQFVQASEARFEVPIWYASIDVITRHRLRSHDAIHVATARAVGGRTFVTFDDDFRRIPDLDVRVTR